jgi:hypothetical protein
MTISRHNITAYINNNVLPVIDASIKIDDSWSPYVQASFTTSFTEERGELVDPRNGNRVTLFTDQIFGNSDPFSTWSTIYGGGTIAAMTTAYGGGFIYELSAQHYSPYNNFGARSATMRTFNLTIRSRAINHEAGTITVDLASNEALLIDYALVSNEILTPLSTDVRTLTNLTLAYIGARLQDDDLATGTVEQEAQYWEPGQTAWDYLAPLVQQAGLILYCDENQLWHLIDDTYIAPGQTSLDYTNTLTEAVDIVSRDDFNWYDAVVIKYTWTGSAGATNIAYDTATNGSITKVYTLTYDGQRYPGAGAAQKVLDRAQGRGRVNEVTAVSDYNTTPRQPATIDLPFTDTQTGFISSVTFNYPADTMDVKTRGLINTPDTAWVFQPVGLRWQDISTGVSWATFV